MKFDTKYPVAATIKAAFPDRLMGPHEYVWAEMFGDTFQSWRNYPCTVCGAITGWRVELADCPPAAICSEECRSQFLGVVESDKCSPSKEVPVANVEAPSDTPPVGAVPPVLNGEPPIAD